MTEPLISHTVLLIVWAVAGVLFAFFLTFVKMVRSDLPLTTQLDQTTGMKHHGILLWFAGFLALGSGVPVALLTLGWIANHILFAVIAAVLVVAFIVGRYMWRTRDLEPAQEYVQPQPAPEDTQRYLTPFPPQPAPPAIWSAPIGADEHWARRQG